MAAGASLLLASLVFFAAVIAALALSYRRADIVALKQRLLPRNVRREAEELAAANGGWYIVRGTALFHAQSDAHFIDYCREGRIHPSDQVLMAESRVWTIAAHAPLAGVVFPARLLPVRKRAGYHPLVLAFLGFWWFGMLGEISEFVAASAGSKVAAIVSVGLLLLTLYIGSRFLKSPVTATEP